MDAEYGIRWYKLRAFFTVLGSFLIHLMLGSVYSYEDICTIIMNRKNVSYPSTVLIPEHLTHVMYLFAAGMFGLSASMSFAGFVKKRMGRSLLMLLGNIIISAGVLMTAVTINDDIGHIALTYGLVCGLGCGILYAVSLDAASEWFRRRKGLIIGVVSSGFSFGPIIVHAFKIYYLDNQKDLSFFFIVIGSMICSVLTIAILIMRQRQPFIGEEMNDSIINSEETSILRDCSTRDLQPHFMIFEFDFWIFWITLALHSFGAILTLQLYPTIELSYYEIRSNISTLYIFSVLNGIGRIVWGHMIDKFSYRTIMTVMTLTACLLFAVAVLFFQDFVNRKYVELIYIIHLGILNLWLSGIFSIFPAIIVKRFGQKYFTSNFGILWTSFSVAGIILSFILLYALQQLEMTCTAFAILMFISFILTQFYNGKSRRLHGVHCWIF